MKIKELEMIKRADDIVNCKDLDSAFAIMTQAEKNLSLAVICAFFEERRQNLIDRLHDEGLEVDEKA